MFQMGNMYLLRSPAKEGSQPKRAWDWPEVQICMTIKLLQIAPQLNITGTSWPWDAMELGNSIWPWGQNQ